jgi:hypothetical protein
VTTESRNPEVSCIPLARRVRRRVCRIQEVAIDGHVEELLVASGPLLVASGPLLVASGPLLVASGPLLVASGPLLVASGLLLFAGCPWPVADFTGNRQQQAASSKQQAASSKQQPATSNQQPASSNQQAATSNQQRAAAFRAATRTKSRKAPPLTEQTPFTSGYLN